MSVGQIRESLFKIFGLIALALFIHSLAGTAKAQTSGYQECYSLHINEGYSDFDARRFCPEFATFGFVECLKTYKNYQQGLIEGRRHCPTTANRVYNDCLEFYVDREAGNTKPRAVHFQRARWKCPTNVSASYMYCLDVLTNFEQTIMTAENYCKKGRTWRHVQCLEHVLESGATFMMARRQCRNVF